MINTDIVVYDTLLLTLALVLYLAMLQILSVCLVISARTASS